MTTYDEIGKTEDAATRGRHALGKPQHGMTFTTPDGQTELMCLNVPGTVPIPSIGATILLHEHQVTVLSTVTSYYRDETDGRVKLFTLVHVRAADDPEGADA